MAFINETGVIGSVMVATVSATGDPFMAYFIVFMMVLFAAIMFRLGLIEMMLIVAPLAITLMSNSGVWYGIGGAVMIALGVFIARNWFVPAR
jgi:hypothetical protein